MANRSNSHAGSVCPSKCERDNEAIKMLEDHKISLPAPIRMPTCPPALSGAPLNNPFTTSKTLLRRSATRNVKLHEEFPHEYDPAGNAYKPPSLDGSSGDDDFTDKDSGDGQLTFTFKNSPIFHSFECRVYGMDAKCMFADFSYESLIKHWSTTGCLVVCNGCRLRRASGVQPGDFFEHLMRHRACWGCQSHNENEKGLQEHELNCAYLLGPAPCPTKNCGLIFPSFSKMIAHLETKCLGSAGIRRLNAAIAKQCLNSRSVARSRAYDSFRASLIRDNCLDEALAGKSFDLVDQEDWPYVCPDPSCEYGPFQSASRLFSHVEDVMNLSQGRKPWIQRISKTHGEYDYVYFLAERMYKHWLSWCVGSLAAARRIIILEFWKKDVVSETSFSHDSIQDIDNFKEPIPEYFEYKTSLYTASWQQKSSWMHDLPLVFNSVLIQFRDLCDYLQQWNKCSDAVKNRAVMESDAMEREVDKLMRQIGQMNEHDTSGFNDRVAAFDSINEVYSSGGETFRKTALEEVEEVDEDGELDQIEELTEVELPNHNGDVCTSSACSSSGSSTRDTGESYSGTSFDESTGVNVINSEHGGELTVRDVQSEECEVEVEHEREELLSLSGEECVEMEAINNFNTAKMENEPSLFKLRKLNHLEKVEKFRLRRRSSQLKEVMNIDECGHNDDNYLTDGEKTGTAKTRTANGRGSRQSLLSNEGKESVEVRGSNIPAQAISAGDGKEGGEKRMFSVPRLSRKKSFEVLHLPRKFNSFERLSKIHEEVGRRMSAYRVRSWVHTAREMEANSGGNEDGTKNERQASVNRRLSQTKTELDKRRHSRSNRWSVYDFSQSDPFELVVNEPDKGTSRQRDSFRKSFTLTRGTPVPRAKSGVNVNRNSFSLSLLLASGSGSTSTSRPPTLGSASISRSTGLAPQRPAASKMFTSSPSPPPPPPSPPSAPAPPCEQRVKKIRSYKSFTKRLGNLSLRSLRGLNSLRRVHT